MFSKSVSSGGITFDNFIKIIPYSGLLCTTNITGSELINIIKNVQVGKNSFHPTSGLRQYVQINTEGKKEIINVEIYDENNVINKIVKDKIYVMASSDIVLNEDSFDDFRQKDVLNIIQDKVNKNMIKCSEKDLNLILYEFFKEQNIIDLTDIEKYTKERIVFLNESTLNF